jgi:hypothetical protein
VSEFPKWYGLEQLTFLILDENNADPEVAEYVV